ncbi:hypothetical protein B4U80_12400, partial [Leptotrombidium deliense]
MENEPCCVGNNFTYTDKCAAIAISENDMYRSFPDNFQCMNFIRSDRCYEENMKTHRPQNDRTPFIDAGFIYGTNEEENDAIRLRKNGLLKSEFKKNKRSEFMIDDGANDVALCGYVRRKFYPNEK